MVRKVKPTYAEQMEAKAETLEVRCSGTGFLVKSNTKKERWYRASSCKCECKGFRYRGVCSHVLGVWVRGKTAPASRYPFCVFCGVDIVPEAGQETKDAVLNHVDSLAHQMNAGPEPEQGAVREGCRGKLRLRRR